jgi:hypothetical protein
MRGGGCWHHCLGSRCIEHHRHLFATPSVGGSQQLGSVLRCNLVADQPSQHSARELSVSDALVPAVPAKRMTIIGVFDSDSCGTFD